MAVRPSTGTNTTLPSVYTSGKSWNTDLTVNLMPGAKRYPEPISRSLNALSKWIDDSTNGDGTLLAAQMKAIYPVGCIYESTVSTNPATLFGFGTWVKFGEGKFLLGEQSTTYPAAATGGSKDAIVVAHSHVEQMHSTDLGVTGSEALPLTHETGGTEVSGVSVADVYASSTRDAISTQSTGVSGTDANMPPYVVVYRWTRTA